MAGSFIASLLLLLKVSRPGFWFITVWLYIVPCGGPKHAQLTETPQFWIGLIYCTFPLNLLTYSWNDLGDQNVDIKNPRKGEYLLGTKNIDNKTLKWIRNFAVLLNLVFGLYFALNIGVVTTVFLAPIVFVSNYLYNEGPAWRRGPPPWDLFGPLGWLFVLQLSVLSNGLEPLSILVWLFHIFMILRSQLWGQIIDFGCDQAAGRRTTAVVLGIRNARKLLFLFVLAELCTASFFLDPAIKAFSGISALQALVEIFFYPPKSPSLYLAVLTGLVMTPAAGVLLIRVWFNGSFRFASGISP